MVPSRGSHLTLKVHMVYLYTSGPKVVEVNMTPATSKYTVCQLNLRLHTGTIMICTDDVFFSMNAYPGSVNIKCTIRLDLKDPLH